MIQHSCRDTPEESDCSQKGGDLSTYIPVYLQGSIAYQLNNYLLPWILVSPNDTQQCVIQREHYINKCSNGQCNNYFINICVSTITQQSFDINYYRSCRNIQLTLCEPVDSTICHRELSITQIIKKYRNLLDKSRYF
ncbi:hypothetical protein PV327_007481 [Microctonus hyperodae]|uniref:Uncharacterized protein n=1 Tax=Microctonus hyperodae TaxID=165561 RepID=A0AA39FZK9_MICHY|nr:hypothetical protein PV327_007481 [Microctonus hyperodae]